MFLCNLETLEQQFLALGLFIYSKIIEDLKELLFLWVISIDIDMI
jgi:hypothetical protein